MSLFPLMVGHLCLVRRHGDVICMHVLYCENDVTSCRGGRGSLWLKKKEFPALKRSNIITIEIKNEVYFKINILSLVNRRG